MTGRDLEERKATLADQLRARAATVQQTPTAEACVILVDVSGSMNDSINRTGGRKKIEAVRNAIPNLRAQGSRVIYSLVEFQSYATILQSGTYQFGLIISDGEKLSPTGMTNITDGIRKGLEVLGDKWAEKKRMILLSDGQGNEETYAMQEMLERCKHGKIVIDSIAFGESADVVTLKRIATETGGVFYNAQNERQLMDAYKKLNYTVRYLEHK